MFACSSKSSSHQFVPMTDTQEVALTASEENKHSVFGLRKRKNIRKKETIEDEEVVVSEEGDCVW